MSPNQTNRDDFDDPADEQLPIKQSAKQSTGAHPIDALSIDPTDPFRDIKSYDFDELAAGQTFLRIELQGTFYFLRRTKTGGLILNK